MLVRNSISVFTVVAVLAAGSFARATGKVAGVVAKQKDAIIIANSHVTDPSAKKISRAVGNESLKTISTKDVVATDAPTIEKIEDGEPVLPAKVSSEDAPGVHKESDRAPAAEPKPKSPEAEKALQWLQNGNKRYLKKANRSDGKSQADRDRLTKEQKPYAIVLSCSDSRVPPETVFDQALGEIFVVRTAGESLDSAVIASLEYAVEHLGPRLLVVMGHTSCGAVSAAIGANEGSSAGSPALDLLVADIRPRLPNRGPAGTPSESLEIESSANAQGVAADLMKRSSIIRARVEKGDLVIKPALYHLDTGTVKFY